MRHRVTATDYPWWTPGLDASLDLLNDRLIQDVRAHRALCGVCALNTSGAPCPALRKIIDQAVAAARDQALEQRATWLRSRETEPEPDLLRAQYADLLYGHDLIGPREWLDATRPRRLWEIEQLLALSAEVIVAAVQEHQLEAA